MAGTDGSASSEHGARKHEMILIHTDAAPIQAEQPTHHQTNRVHIDITPNDGVDAAIERILELGGSVKKPPSLYPRPGTYGDEAPVIDWAVMQDPFGNEFCLVHDLTAEQSAAAMHAARHGATSDHDTASPLDKPDASTTKRADRWGGPGANGWRGRAARRRRSDGVRRSR